METFNQSVKLVNPVDDFPAMAEELYGLNFMGEVNVGNIEVFCVNHECESLLFHLTNYVRLDDRSITYDIVQSLPHVVCSYNEDHFVVAAIPSIHATVKNNMTLREFCRMNACTVPSDKNIKRYTFRVQADPETLYFLYRLVGFSIGAGEIMKKPFLCEYVTLNGLQIRDLQLSYERGFYVSSFNLENIILKMNEIVFGNGERVEWEE